VRSIVQPGPAPQERVDWIEARGRRVAFDLLPGASLLDAVRESFAAQGFSSGVLNLEGGAFGPFAYVMPALSDTPRHAAFYSETMRPPGLSRIRAGALTFGARDGAPFFHCHALWTEEDGALHGGHVLPDGTTIAESVRASGIGLTGAGFSARPDPETNFALFGPVQRQAGQGAAESRVFALRLRPNQDLSHALEDFCRAHGVTGATLHGGVGSIVGARFADGRAMEPFATEIAIRRGRIATDARGMATSEIDIALVDYTGGIGEGRLVRGDNPVLMTLEVVLEADA